MKQASHTRSHYKCGDIEDLLNYCRALSRRQVQVALYGEGNYAGWKTRVKLLQLYREKRVRRGRADTCQDYVYWKGRRPEHLDHLLMINWVYIALRNTGKLQQFKHVVSCDGIVIPDGYFVMDGKPWYLEAQRANNHAEFDKVGKYVKWQESQLWDTDEWPLPGKFARVLVVADTANERDRLARLCKSDQVKFIVTSLEEVVTNPIKALFPQEKIIKWRLQ